MTRDECVRFVTNGRFSRLLSCGLTAMPRSAALALAMQRDGSSGGIIRLAVITEDFNVERLLITNPPTFFGLHLSPSLL